MTLVRQLAGLEYKQMNKKFQTFFFIVGLAIFIFLILHFGIDKIISNIKETGWWFLPIIGVWGFAYVLNSLSWSAIIDSKKHGISFAEIYAITVSGFAINYITPVMNLGGEPYRIMKLKDRIGLTNAVSSTISYTMIHFLSHFFFWISAIILISVFLPLSYELKIIFGAVFVVLVSAIIFFISRHKNGVFESFLSLLAKLPMLKKTVSKINNKMNFKDIDAGITEFYEKRKSAFVSAIIWDYLARVIAAMEFFFILYAIGIHITILEAVYISAATSLITNILFFMPMELGTREGGTSVIMKSLNFAPGIGIYISVIYRIREFFWILIGLILIKFGKIKKPTNNVEQSI